MAEARKALEKAREGAQRAKLEPNAGLEWDILLADAAVLIGLTNALEESYMGLVRCL